MWRFRNAKMELEALLGPSRAEKGQPYAVLLPVLNSRVRKACPRVADFVFQDFVRLNSSITFAAIITLRWRYHSFNW